jgi:hypothetical protein
MFSQGLVLRESLYARHEAELAMGLALAAWILFSGLGGLAAMRIAERRQWWAASVTALGLVAPSAAWLCRLGLIDPVPAASAAGLLAGLVFALPFGKGCRVAVICSAEAAGALAGGVLFSILSASMLMGGLVSAAAALCFGAASFSGAPVPIVMLLGILGAIFTGQPRRLDVLSAVHGPAMGSDSFSVAASARGEVVVSWRSGQASLWRSGMIESYDSAPEAGELLTLLPLAYAGTGRILYLGSSPDAAVLLSSNSETDVIVPDESSLSRVEAIAPHAACRVSDERRAVEVSDHGYALIILQAGLPLSLLSNRLCTREFFRDCRSALAPGGILAFTLPVSQTRLVPEQAAILGPILASGRIEFPNCRILPLGGAMVLLSEQSLGEPAEVAAAGWQELEALSPVFLDSVSIQWELSPGRISAWASSLDLPGGPPNTDLRPCAFTAASRNWSTRMGLHSGGGAVPAILAASALLLACTAALMGRRAAVAIVPCALGASSAASETAAILMVQATLGISWAVLALAPGLFMCGYSAGSALLAKRNPCLSGISGSLAVTGLAALCYAYNHGEAGSGALTAGAAACLLLTGLFSGSAFPPSALLAGGGAKGAVLVNAAAAAGGAAGAVAFPLLLFPYAGAAPTLLWTGVAACVVSALSIPALRRVGPEEPDAPG